MKLIIRHLEAVERLDGQDVEPCAAIDEGLGDLHIADDGSTKHWESASGSGVIRLQRIYNFLLLHAMLSTVLGNIGLYYPLLYYFWD